MGEVESKTSAMIDAALNEASKKEKLRDYLGASILGDDCSRKIWYYGNLPRKAIEARTQRIFDMGNIVEEYIIKLLRQAGITVYDTDENGEQFGFEDEEIAGHIDGVLTGVPCIEDIPTLLEAKSSNKTRFNQFVKNGVQETEIKYWVQTQVYMLKMNLKQCLFVALNKDNQEIYFEVIHLDAEKAKYYINRGKQIMRTNTAPPRRYTKSTFFKCRMCEFSDSCWSELDEC